MVCPLLASYIHQVGSGITTCHRTALSYSFPLENIADVIIGSNTFWARLAGHDRELRKIADLVSLRRRRPEIRIISNFLSSHDLTSVSSISTTITFFDLALLAYSVNDTVIFHMQWRKSIRRLSFVESDIGSVCRICKDGVLVSFLPSEFDGASHTTPNCDVS